MIPEAQCIVVLGMHRSSTSLVTKALQALGVDLGQRFLEPDFDNPKGFWENKDILELNEAMLHTLGHSWDSVGLFGLVHSQIDALSEFRDRARRIIESNFSASALWGFKDPRVCRLLPFWREMLADCGCRVRYLVSIRNPFDVAGSLWQRNGLPEERSLLLWLLHYGAVTRDLPEPADLLVHYDAILKQPEAELYRIASLLGIDVAGREEQIREFASDYVEKGLKHFTDGSPPSVPDDLAELCARAFRTLLEWAESSRIPADGWRDFSGAFCSSAVYQQCIAYLDPQEFFRATIQRRKKVQLFLDLGAGFNENDSFFLDEARGGEGAFEADLSRYGLIRGLRIDPDNRRCAVRLKRLETIRLNGKVVPVTQYSSNAVGQDGDLLAFETDDPQILFYPDSPLRGIRLHFAYEYSGRSLVRQLRERDTSERDALRRDLEAARKEVEEIQAVMARQEAHMARQEAHMARQEAAMERQEADHRSALRRLEAERRLEREGWVGRGKQLEDKARAALAGQEDLLRRAEGLLLAALQRDLSTIDVPAIAPEDRAFSGEKAPGPEGSVLPVRRVRHPRTLFISHDASRTGAPFCLLHLLRWLRANTDLEFKVILGGNGAIAEHFQEVAECFFFSDVRQRLGAGRRFDQALRDFCGADVELVYANTVVTAEVLEALSFLDAPVICHVHELENVIRLCAGEGMATVLARTSRFIAASPAVRENLIGNHGVAARDTITIYESIVPSTDAGQDSKAGARRKLGLPAEAFLVFGCGTVEWRKGTDLFVEAARSLRARGIEDFHFYWIGEVLERDFPNLVADVRREGLDSHVSFLGVKNDPREYFAAADAFLLTSREDPFPLVCLEAAEKSLPVLCFAQAGGMPDFVGEDAGFVVPFEDVEALADKVVALRDDPDLRARLGRSAREKVLARHIVDVTAPEILRVMHDVAPVGPLVSVIVPNYKHERFLPQRLDSIFGQTYRHFEVVILDDCSPDGSLDVIDGYAWRPFVTVLAGESNSGNVFRQWIKGLRAARGELVWIAESDDFCSPQFLERLVPCFDDPGVMLAFSQSLPVNPDGVHTGEFTYLDYVRDLSDTKWRSDYRLSGRREVAEGLAVKNTIPNASAVVTRRPDPDELEAGLVAFTISGDWYYYLWAANRGKICFVSDALNFHRRHGESVVARNERALVYFTDLARVHGFALRHFPLSRAVRERMRAHVLAEWRRFHGDRDLGELRGAYPLEMLEQPGRAPLGILLVVSDLAFGGGQIFAIRLANAFAKTGHHVTLLNVGMYDADNRVRAMTADEVRVLEAREWSNPGEALNSLIREEGIGFVNSHIWWADKFVADHLEEDVPWAVTMHGCCEHLLHEPACDLHFPDIMRRMVERAHFVYIAEKNLEVFEAYPPPDRSRLVKIYNGFAEELPEPEDRERHGIAPEDFVVGIVSRAIPEKGWEIAIEAVQRCNSQGTRPVHLMLIGESDYSKDLQRRYSADRHIHFTGFSRRPLAYIQMFDVGLLPSFYTQESLPNCVTEYLACGKPVIATRLGDIPLMLETGEGLAGSLLEQGADGRPSAEELAERLLGYLRDPDLLAGHAELARKAFEKFDMSTCVRGYLEIPLGPRRASAMTGGQA